MNRLQILATASLLFAAHAADAGTSAVPNVDVSPPSLTIACDQPRLPSQNDVSRVLGINNLTETYAARSRLMTSVRQACKGGTTQLLVQRASRQSGLTVVALDTRELAVTHRRAGSELFQGELDRR